MNINLGQMANGNTSININVHPNIHSTQPTVTVNGSEQGNTALIILRSLADGDTFSANITDVSGEQVTITLDGGQSFTASLLNSTAETAAAKEQKKLFIKTPEPNLSIFSET